MVTLTALWRSLPPLDLTPFGMPTRTLLVAAHLAFATAGSGGRSVWSLRTRAPAAVVGRG